MFFARIETRNFEFMAFGETEEEARAALATGWENHCLDYGGVPDPEYLVDYADDIGIGEFEVGDCIRDYEVLKRRADR